jgi:hypothetical protein
MAFWQAAFLAAARGTVDADPQRITRRTLTPRPTRGHGVEQKADAATGDSRRRMPLGGGGPNGLRPNREHRAPLILRPPVVTRHGHRLGASCWPRVPSPVRFSFRFDPDEDGAPERVELSGAGALGASQFGFDALDRVVRPELSDELLDATAEGARDEALLPRRGRGG